MAHEDIAEIRVPADSFRPRVWPSSQQRTALTRVILQQSCHSGIMQDEKPQLACSAKDALREMRMRGSGKPCVRAMPCVACIARMQYLLRPAQGNVIPYFFIFRHSVVLSIPSAAAVLPRCPEFSRKL